jgi:hypothetical protein
VRANKTLKEIEMQSNDVVVTTPDNCLLDKPWKLYTLIAGVFIAPYAVWIPLIIIFGAWG